MQEAVNLNHLRQVGLTAWEIQKLTQLAARGGEVPWYPRNYDPLTLRCMDGMITKRLVTIVDRSGALAVRLTDEGRTVVTQLDAMAVKPKVEVAST